MDVQKIYQESESKMKKAVEATKREFVNVRTGRASSALFETIRVEYYGTLVPLNQVANITVVDARTIEIKPWDATALVDIEKAILKSELGLTPNNDGKLIRISIPLLTEERRKELVKTVKKDAEEGKVGIRAIRQEANKTIDQLKKEKHISEDVAKDAGEKIQKMTNHYSQEIDQLALHKEKEILDF
jgi:ribosome recycling factor